MRLPKDQVARFYNMWMALLTFVNKQRGLLPGREVWDLNHPIKPEDALVVRDALWSSDELREEFVAQNPAGLSDEDLLVVTSWRHRVAGNFFILKHLKKHSIFSGNNRYYAVLGLHSPIEEITPFTPCLVEAVLLPYEDHIIFDSLLKPMNISFGGNMRGRFNQDYQEARKRGDIITSLLAQPSKKVTVT